MERALGSVQVAQYAVGFVIAYSGDAAVLDLSIKGEAGPVRYAPLFASTYRGIPPVDLEVHVSASKEEVWVKSSWAGSETLAYHRLGTDTAMTGFGEQPLMNAPMPDGLGGGPLPFPTLDPGKSSKVASFHHQE